jgi:hypothetical protein
LRDEWNTNHTGANRDLVAGVTSDTIGGGFAWGGVVGEANGFSVNDSDTDGDFSVYWRHEMGHNWGLGHYDGNAPEGKTINSGNQYARMSGPELELVLRERDEKLAILDDEGVYTAVSLPPYAALDTATMTQVVDNVIAINVLANDHDANGQALSLTAFDSLSAQGGSVTQSGPYLVYKPPSGAYIGSDYFTYTVGDASNQQAVGIATVSIEPDDTLRLYLPLNEDTGTAVADLSPFKLSGTLNGTDFDTDSVPGRFGSAVALDGADNYIAVENVKLQSDTVTLAAWIKPAATQDDYAGVIFDRSNGGAGVNIMSTRTLRYHWPASTCYSWDSGLVVPADTWTFVALVVRPTGGTLYMNSGSGMLSATNLESHVAATFGTTGIGRDLGWGSSRTFTGAIDDVRVYNRAMDAFELQALYNGGKAEGPNPVDHATGVTVRELSWAAAANALTNRVYIGTNQVAVQHATLMSPEYMASLSASSYRATLEDATTYYWRIDSVTASSVVTGSVWTFETGTILKGDTILINFQRNSTEAFDGGQAIGPTADDSSYWNTLMGASGTQSNLIDNAGDTTLVSINWNSAGMWSNGDGTGDDEHRLSVGYLDDGNSGAGKGVTLTVSGIPYSAYRVYGLFANGNTSSACGIVNVNVNGIWALGGSATTTAPAWGHIDSNYSEHGSYWTEIDPGSVQANYWTVDTTGDTCLLVTEPRNGDNRGCLTGLIIQKLADADGDGIADESDPDDDNDGIPDAWEVSHGLNSLSDDAGENDDGDRFDNMYEYVTDTNPQDDASYQRFTIDASQAGSNVVLRFNTSASRSYRVEYNDHIVSNTWQALGTMLAGDGTEMTVSNTFNQEKCFYRLRIAVPY